MTIDNAIAHHPQVLARVKRYLSQPEFEVRAVVLKAIDNEGECYPLAAAPRTATGFGVYLAVATADGTEERWLKDTYGLNAMRRAADLAGRIAAALDVPTTF